MREKKKMETAKSAKGSFQAMKDSARSSSERNVRKEEKRLEINNPSTWTVSNIDQVAAAVKHHPSAGYSEVFWNTYAGSFGTIPCNIPLRSMIIRAKHHHSAYAMIPDEEYLGDVTALMWAGMLHDWMPDRESLERYIGCRCRPNAEYGRSIIRTHGNRVYALVKDNGDGSSDIRSLSISNSYSRRDYTKKYVNLPVMSIDSIVCEDGDRPLRFLERYGVSDNCLERIEAESTRRWLMEVCNVTEYEMRICEAVAGYGKCLDAWIVEEINAKIVIPSGMPPMSQEDIYKFNFRVHKRARYHYRKAMSGIR